MINYKLKEKSPCRKCEDRYPTCHSHCEKYIEWADELQKEKDLFWSKESCNSAFRSLCSDRKNRIIKEKIRNRR